MPTDEDDDDWPPDDVAGADRWFEKITARQANRRRLIANALALAAFVATDRTGRATLVIRSGEMQTPEEGRWRATYFRADGPLGHVVRNTDADLAKAIDEDLSPVTVRVVDESEVIAWTSTPEFEEGARHVAEIQALNARGFR